MKELYETKVYIQENKQWNLLRNSRKQKSHGNLWGRTPLANKARTKLYATYLLLQPPPLLPLLLTSHATSNRMRTRWNLFLERNKKISFLWRNIWLNYRLQYIPLGCISEIFIANVLFYCQIAFYCIVIQIKKICKEMDRMIW